MAMLGRGLVFFDLSVVDMNGHVGKHALPVGITQETTIAQLQTALNSYVTLVEAATLGSVKAANISYPFYNDDWSIPEVVTQAEDKMVISLSTSNQFFSDFAIPCPDLSKLLDAPDGGKLPEFNANDDDILALTTAMLDGLDAGGGVTLEPQRITGEDFVALEAVYHRQDRSQKSNKRRG